MKFPVFKTKIAGVRQEFDLTNHKERGAYFEAKAGADIKKLRRYLEHNSFIAYLLGKKNSGKGTYAKMFAEIVAPEKIQHFSIGDIIREVDKELKDKKKRQQLINFLKNNYRGWLSIEKIISLLEKRNTEKLLPTELILILAKREITKRKKKALFIDGFPRDLDQIAHSLFFRDLIDYRQDPDIFILINVSRSVINERIKWRRICPLCQTSRNLKLLPTSKVGYNKKKKEFYLICDNPNCKGAKMVSKEGDKSGIKLIKKRLIMDEKLIDQSFSLYGVPKVLLRNSVPIKFVKKYIDDYEITPEFCYKWDEKEKKVKIFKKPWIIKDDNGIASCSLMPGPVVVSMLKQMVKALNL